MLLHYCLWQSHQHPAQIHLRLAVRSLIHCWHKMRQLFGAKSEKQEMVNPHQLHLGEEYKIPSDAEDTRPKKTITYQRGIGPKVRPEDCITDTGLRFDDSVPQKAISSS